MGLHTTRESSYRLGFGFVPTGAECLVFSCEFHRVEARCPTSGPAYPSTSFPRPPQSMPVVGLEAWFTQIPPVTRTWLALSVLTSVAVVRARTNGPPAHPSWMPFVATDLKVIDQND